MIGDTSGFNALGIVTDPKASQQGRLLINQFRQQGLSFKAAELEARSVLQTGDTLPSISTTKSGDTFFKLVNKKDTHKLDKPFNFPQNT